MKKIMVLLGAFAALMISWVAFAETVIVEELGTGELMIVYPRSPNTIRIEQVFDTGVLDYGDKWKEAYNNPDTVVPIKTHSTHGERVGMLHVRTEDIVDIGVIKDAAGIHLVRDLNLGPQIGFNPFFLLWLVAFLAEELFLVLVFNLAQKEKVHDWVCLVGFILLLIAFVCPIFTWTYTTLVFSPFSVMAATAGVVAGISIPLCLSAEVNAVGKEKKEKLNCIGKCIYFGCMVVSLLAFLAS
ncbi:MAG: hypothetical protein WCW36_00080 [Candidatus Paceibacterota bacterium]